MSDRPVEQMSRREREIMDILFEVRQATAMEVMKKMEDPPSYSGVRGLLRILEEKGYVSHTRNGARFLYVPKHDRTAVAKSSLSKLLQTYFDGSVESAVAAMLDSSAKSMDESDFDALDGLIREAREKRSGR